MTEKMLESKTVVRQDSYVSLYSNGDTLYVILEGIHGKRMKQIFTIEGWGAIESVEETRDQNRHPFDKSP